MPWQGTQPTYHFSQQVWKNILLQSINCLFLWQRWLSFLYLFFPFPSELLYISFTNVPEDLEQSVSKVSVFPFSSLRLIIFHLELWHVTNGTPKTKCPKKRGKIYYHCFSDRECKEKIAQEKAWERPIERQVKGGKVEEEEKRRGKNKRQWICK